MVPTLIDEKELDTEWAELILEALKTGISVDEIRDFFNQSA
ncbi:anti-repressor SinI family protein [Neobacillus ginsengisoli]|uniref:DNA-binding transcriptional MerR regulator n=1 Tax=Neobacillus ginsengisoli TaxID=904295 RepID=A0ABT9Y243_9BACI|nr:anti-repressor SinI family protein [Neobacillus ginsengisoli]MDQ0201888.1 DNA-binding transcriptional MerR regulator [Neobacillus ginsengisoli]